MATKNTGVQKYKYYKVEGDSVERIKKVCPKCGPGVFMAEHLNRYACGKCGYTEWKKNE
ncbi:30S ribosomal protein S27ae [Methanothermococcus sp. Ax23]|jgi:small subunit ribosomal protein S27Ae|uniref:30S ribosomal protein S27ae n=1 Tax=Methanothermococcus sp. Ax23 TaxID=3156486 RepID=UPI003B9EB466